MLICCKSGTVKCAFELLKMPNIDLSVAGSFSSNVKRLTPVQYLNNIETPNNLQNDIKKIIAFKILWRGFPMGRPMNFFLNHTEEVNETRREENTNEEENNEMLNPWMKFARKRKRHESLMAELEETSTEETSTEETSTERINTMENVEHPPKRRKTTKQKKPFGCPVLNCKRNKAPYTSEKWFLRHMEKEHEEFCKIPYLTEEQLKILKKQ